MWTTRSGVVGLAAAVLTLAAAVLTLAAAFFFGFPAAGLVAAVDLGSGFLCLAVFLVAVTLGCLGNGSAWIAVGILETRTTPPTLAGHRVR